MAKNKALELSIKIAGSVDKSLMSAVTQTNHLMGSLTTGMSKLGTAGLATMGAIATATAAGIAKCTDEAAKLTNSMAPMMRYVDGLSESANTTAKQAAVNLKAMRGYIQDLSTDIPRTTDQLATMSAALGQSGIDAAEQMKSGILRDTAIAATAMDLEDKLAGDYMAKWEESFKFNHEQVMELMDQINYLGANNATTAAEIAQSVNQAASMGQIAGVDPAATAALATAMQATGVATDRVGTSISRIYTNISKGANATKAQKTMWQELGFSAEGIAKSMQSDGIGTLQQVFAAINDLPDERKVAALNTLFGQWAIEGGAKVTQNLALLGKTLSEVNDQSLYTGSMEREFLIQASTPEAVDTMLSNAKAALMQDVGQAFLPAKKAFGQTMIDFLNQVRKNVPQLTTLAETLGTLASNGIERLGAALEKALPYIQKGLDYLANNGDQVAGTIGKMAAVFAGMKLAPGIAQVLGGAGNLLFGSGSGGKRSGGLLGGVKNLFTGGQNAAANMRSILGIGMTEAGKQSGGLFQKIAAGIGGAFSGGKNWGGVNSKRSGVRKAAWESIHTAAANAGIWAGDIKDAGGGLWGTVKGLVTSAHANSLTGQGSFAQNLAANLLGKDGRQSIGSGIGGLLGSVFSPLGKTGVGKYAGNVFSSLGNMAKSTTGLMWTLIGESDTSSPGKSLMGNLVQGITGTLSGGAGVLKSVWSPIVSGFGSIFSGAAPVIGVISAIIAVVSILGDHLEDIRGIIQNVFGEKGVAIFDKFVGVLQNIGSVIQGLFEDGGVANAFAPLRDAITNLFGDDAGAAFDGLVEILQAVMGVVQQVVEFATGTVKPIIEDIFGFITGTVVPILVQTFTSAAPSIAGIVSGLGSAIMTVMQIIGEAIQAVMPIVKNVITAVMNIASVVIPAVLAGASALLDGIGPILESIKTVFEGLIQFLSGVFTGDWGKIWEGVKQIFGGAFDALVGLFKTPINAVFALINKAIQGINSIGITLPNWGILGDAAGKSLSINIPEIPLLAKGGFTDGVSIAGEAGREAVISFQRGVRAQNIATWAQAGRMLGVSAEQALGAAGGTELKDIRADERESGGGSFTFAPNIVIQGNADRDVLDEALRRARDEFEAWYEQMMRRRARMAY
uniref:Minor tail protein n=1 Tax=Caudovirales sp. ctu3532 TaxID=2827639 RepID=A0A8S5THV5_9CAUD|nr:MAG TPA: minor tail protein [Caudovirales sp. ctu3532]